MKYPLLSIQEGILFHTLQHNKGVYIIQVVLRLGKELNQEFFWKAWETIIQRHDLLRSKINLENEDTPTFEVLSQVNLSKKIINISSLISAQQEQIFQNHLKVDSQKLFDLNISPYMRFHLFQFGDHERLVWSVHHILLGMANSGITVLREVFEVYNALVNGKTYNLSELKPYKKILEEINNYCDKKAAEIYWKNVLKGYVNTPVLPLLDKYNEQHNLQSSYDFIIPAKSYKKCQDFISRAHTTMNVLIQAAWGLLLKYYTGENDIVFGSVRAYSRSIIENGVGLFINTLPVRAMLQTPMTILEYLKTIHNQKDGIRKYVTTPLYKIQEWTNQAALFNTVVDFKPISLFKAVNQNLSSNKLIEEISLSVNTNYPLVITVTDEGAFLSVKIHYAVNLYESKQMQMISRHLATIFDQLINEKLLNIADISMFDEEEKFLLLHKWNQTDYDFGFYKPVHKLFEEQVRKTPNKIALELDEKFLTYEELNKKADVIANKLHYQIKNNDLVGIYADRGFAMICGILGSLKAGAAYLLLDVKIPEKRLNYILKDSQIKIILSERNYCSRLKAIINKDAELTRQLSLDIIENIIEDINKQEIPLNLPAPGYNIAYAIYTSGTTGRPKGVLIEQAAFTNMALTHQHKLKISAPSRVLQFSNPTFDVSVAEWSSALISGATLVILPPGSHFIGETLTSYLQLKKITTVLLPGAILQTLPKVFLENLETLVVGGESCSQDAIDYWMKDRLFINAYGLTETAVCITMQEMEKGLSLPNIIGRPVYNNRIYVLGKNGDLLPIGAIGELCVSGINLARGYLNDESLTREKFINNPFEPNSLLFKTGDLVKRLPDGNLVFIGRRDNQIKIRGYRIEIDEIVNIILQFPEIEQCVVLIHADQSNNKIIVAYLKLQSGDISKDITLNNLKSYLKEQLPSYMIPSVFIIIDAIPLTENGKVNKELLSTYYLKIEHSRNEDIFVADSVEELISTVWKQLLHTDKISFTQNLFDLGAHSLLMLKAANKLRQILDFPIEITDLFQYPTIHSLAKYLEKQGVRIKK